jgi:hypothetical protein
MAVTVDPEQADPQVRRDRIACNLKAAMALAETSIYAIVKATGLDRRGVQRWLQAKSAPGAKSQRALEAFFRVPVGWFEADHSTDPRGPE